MAEVWVDLRALKARVSIRDVLDRYGVLTELRETRPGKLSGPCPIHGGTGKTSFNVDVEKNAFNCFSCCGGGNVLDLVMKLEDCNVREAGVRICEWFNLDFSQENDRSPAGRRNSARVSEKNVVRSDTSAAKRASSDPLTNSPLARPLSNLKPEHEYIQGRGVAVATARQFGLGFCSRGLMRGRIAIPITDATDQLVAYAGRAVTEELAREKGKYRFPTNFHKSHVLYNLTRVKRTDTLVVVEGFFDVLALYQSHVENVVALMGSTLSEQQAELLVNYANNLLLMFDGDDAGRECERECYRKLRTRLYLKSVHLNDGEQPDALSADRIRELLS